MRCESAKRPYSPPGVPLTATRGLVPARRTSTRVPAGVCGFEGSHHPRIGDVLKTCQLQIVHAVQADRCRTACDECSTPPGRLGAQKRFQMSAIQYSRALSS